MGLMNAAGGALNLVRENVARKRRPSQVNYEPTTVQIEVTNNCNLLCIHCGRTNLSNLDAIGGMELERFQHVFNQFNHLRSVSLFGHGEPLMAGHLHPIIDWIRETKGDRFKINVTTNGILLKQKMVDKLVKSNIRLTVSLDATTPEVYEATVVAKSFHKVIAGMERLEQAVVSHGYKWALNFVIMNENVDQIVDIVELAHKYKARKINLGEQNFYGAGGRMSDAFITHKNAVRENVAKAQKRGEELGIRVVFSRRDRDVWPEHDTFVPCKYLWSLPFVTWDGYVCLCCARPYPKVHHFGNVFEKSFQEIWFGDEYAKFRKDVADGTQDTVCRGCQHLSPDAEEVPMEVDLEERATKARAATQLETAEAAAEDKGRKLPTA